MRYEDKLDFDLDLDESIKDTCVIKLLVQPLVENALYHGIKQKEGKGSVQVRIWPVGDDRVRVMVKDDGMGLSRERLAYGDQCEFSIESKQGEGTTILITLPLEYERGDHG